MSKIHCRQTHPSNQLRQTDICIRQNESGGSGSLYSKVFNHCTILYFVLDLQ